MRLAIVTAIILFINGVTASAQTDTVQRTFEKVEVEAEFSGGRKAWLNFLVKNLNPDVPVNKGAPAGKYTVVARFIINKNGALDSIAVETSHGYGMEEEVMRVLAMSPNWQPAIQNERPVRAYRRQPFTFLIEEKGRKRRLSKKNG